MGPERSLLCSKQPILNQKNPVHTRRTNSNCCCCMVQVFDKHNRGYISASDLRAVLQCLGEDLSEEESKYNTALFDF